MSQIQKHIEEIAFNFRKSIPKKLAEIEGMINQLTYHTQTNALWEEVLRRVHSFSGTSGTFGNMGLSKQAKSLEESIEKATRKRKVDKAGLDRIWSHFIALRTVTEKTLQELSGKLNDPNCPIEFSSVNLKINPSKILIISNDEYLAAWIKNSLVDDGHTAYTIGNPANALKLVDLEDYDFIVSDIMLPEMSGQDFAKAYRQLEHKKYAPILFVTSITDDMNLLKCIKSGGDVVLIKPLSMELIRAELFALNRLLKLGCGKNRE